MPRAKSGKFDSTDYKRSFTAANYDRIELTVPKGRKDDIKSFATSNGETVNGFINRLVKSAMKMDDDRWNSKPDDVHLPRGEISDGAHPSELPS